MELTQTFYELLQVALERRDRLSMCPTAEEWEELYATAEKQALTGIAWVGVTRLPKGQRPEELLFLRWTGWANKIKERNERMDVLCGKLTDRFHREGFEAVILKGQAAAAMYPETLRPYRTSGDIDAWVWAASSCPRLEHRIAPVVRYCLSVRPEEMVYYHHVEFPVIPDAQVEVHMRPAWLSCPWLNRKLQAWFNDPERKRGVPCKGFLMPTPEFNLVYQLVHIYRHIYQEGVGLRQLLDYLCLIHNSLIRFARSKRHPDGMPSAQFIIHNYSEALALIRELHLEKFCGAVMWVLGEVFALPREEMLVTPDERRGRELLEEIMIAGNFGHYDPRIKDLAHEGHFRRVTRKAIRSMHLARLYPHESLWTTYFTAYHALWRGLKLWRWE